MFKNIFGNSPQTKILDFLADHPNYDYTISDIARQSEVSRPTVYKFLKKMMKEKLIIKTRNLGISSLYKLNIKNNLVQIILKFDFEFSKMMAEMESGKTVEKYEPTLTSPRSKVFVSNV